MTRFPSSCAILGALLILPVAVVSQEPATIPIGAARVDADVDGVPDRLGDIVTVEGVLISEPLVIGAAAAIANVQDPTGGIILFTRDTTRFSSLTPGDSVRIRGRISQYRGAEQITVHDYEHLGHAAVPEPRNVLVSDLLGEQFAGRLVRTVGELHISTTEEGRITAAIEDRSGRVPVVIPNRFLSEHGFVSSLRRSGEVEVVGIAGQRTDAISPGGGYLLYPRSTDDFTFTPPPRYDYLVLGLGVIIILGLLLWRLATARRAAEFERLAQQLASSRTEVEIREERFRSLVENATDIVTIMDADGVFQYHSPSVTRLLGWPPEELEGHSCTEYIHPQDRARAEELLADVLSDPGTAHQAEVRFQTRKGDWRDLEWTATNRLADSAVRGIVCNARDVTQHKTLELRLRQADRLETVGRLAGGIAHDFNNILTALRGHADIALDEMERDAPGRDDVEEILRATDRATDVTRQLLAFTRQQVRESRVVSVSDAVGDMLGMLRRLIGEDIEISADLCSDGDWVNADPAQIEQIILNLVINARDSMPDGGRIILSVDEEELTQAETERYPYEVHPGRYIRLSVTDSGAGMSEEVLGRVFEPFFTTKEPGKGTGLGLASVYGIVKQSSGYVWGTSEVGAGTRFDIYLPQIEGAVETDMVAGAVTPPAAAAPRGNGEVILLVEDERAVRRLCKRVLRNNGYTVLDADGAEAALQIVDEQPRIDLLLTDVVMSQISGVRLAERLRIERPHLPVLFMSGYTAGEIVPAGEDDTMALLEKPFTPRELLSRVVDRLESRSGCLGAQANGSAAAGLDPRPTSASPPRVPKNEGVGQSREGDSNP